MVKIGSLRILILYIFLPMVMNGFMMGVNSLISEQEPTIVPYPNFNAEKDAQEVHKSMGGFGIGSFKIGNDINKVINIIAGRTNFQRIQIGQAYRVLLKKNLTDDLKSNTRGHAQKFLVALMTPAAQFDAHLINHAIKWLGTDYDTLLEVLATRSPLQLQEMAKAYQSKYKKPMINAIKGDVHGKVEKFFELLLAPNRDSSQIVNQALAYEDAMKLKGGDRVSRWFGGKDDAYIRILGTNNYQQLKLVFDQFQRLTGKTIEEDIKRHTSGKYQKALLKLVESVRSMPQYFAERLHKAMHGLGTDNAALIRILTTRSEVDLNTIKNSYYYKYKKPLEAALRGDVSGPFQKLVLAVIRGNRMLPPHGVAQNRNVKPDMTAVQPQWTNVQRHYPPPRSPPLQSRYP